MTMAGTADTVSRHAESDRDRRLRASHAYVLARRHSRFVRLLRIAIPLGAALSFAGFIVLPFINPFRSAGVSVGAIKMDGTRVTMETPRLAGYRRDNKPYEVTALSAVQDVRVPNVIELYQMTARIVNADDTVINLTALNAVFDSQKEQLQLRNDVKVKTQNGQEAFLKSADVDFKAGTVRSREAVTVRLPDMSVSADSLDIVDNGGRITFAGRVSALIDDKDSKGAAALPAAGPAAPAPPVPVPPPVRPGSAPRVSSTPPVTPPAGASLASNPPPPALSQPLPPLVSAPVARTSPAGPVPRDARGVTVIDPATGKAVMQRVAP